VTQAREAAAEPNSPWRGWGSACAIFSGVVLLSLAATCGVAWQWGGGSRYLLSALTAWGLCWFAALIALVVIIVGRQMGQGVGAVLLGMGIRMGLPLVAALFLSQQSPIWTESKLMPFLLGNYFLALIAETGLAVRLLGDVHPAPHAKAATPSGKLAPKA
jgi:hypothetical protein